MRFLFGGFLCAIPVLGLAITNNIMLTGYWPPTNEMLRQFSANPDQNPGGWRGENWEGRGFNIFSFFPEFPAGTFPVGVGDFTVDYQDTSADWWRIVNQVKPVAIITFSRGNSDNSWEIEYRQRNLVNWVADYVAPFYPTPSPPDSGFAPNGIRYSNLPMTHIARAVNDAQLGINAYIDSIGFGGGFLSEYMAYHGTWYRDLHSDPSDPDRCLMAGHIHVGSQVTAERAKTAAEISLRTLTTALSAVVPEPAPILALSALTLWAFFRRRP